MIRQKRNQESLLDLQWVRRALLLALFDIAIIIASSLLALINKERTKNMIRQKRNQESLLDLQWVRRALLLALFDIAIIIASSLLALLARFDFSYAQIEIPYLSNLCHYLPINIIVTLIIFYFCRMYHSLWKFVGVHEFGYMLLANYHIYQICATIYQSTL